MIPFLARILVSMGEPFGVLRVLDYISVRSIAVAVTTLLLMLSFSPPIIRKLYLFGFRDKQRDFDKHLAKSKSGTPTMGGVIIAGAVTVSLLLWGDWKSPYLWLVMSAFLFFAFLGAVDDLAKLRGQSADAGLSRKMKLLLQGLYGLLLGLFLYHPNFTPFPQGIADTVGVPFLKPALYGGFDLHFHWLYVPFVAFVIIAVSNAVNLIDGLDGLAAGTTIPPIFTYGVFAYILGNVKFTEYLLYPFLPGVHELVVFVAALGGALVGFLWYNGYPAQIFMGDTGSLSLGGTLAALVLLTKQEFLFIIAGGLFIFVNLTHIIGDRIGLNLLGRRLFYRTPIHHSFEHLGYAETKVVLRFFIVAMVLALLALATLKLR